jgi:hypothetical protein
LDVPALPPALIGEDGEELGELEVEEGGESSMLDAELSGRDKESRLTFAWGWLMLMLMSNLGGLVCANAVCDVEFEAALVEMVIRHRNRQSSGEPDGEFAIPCQDSLREVGCEVIDSR